MKKIAFLVVAFVMIASTASAQWGYGPKVGATLANVTDGDNYLVGFTGGMFVDYSLGRSLALSADVLYSGQGTKAKTVGDIKSHYRSHYINVPVMLNYYPVRGFAIKAGLQPGFLVGDKSKMGDVEITNLDGIKKFDLSVPVGLSYEFPIGLIVDARYNIGVTDLKENVANLANWEATYNNVFSLTVGYRF